MKASVGSTASNPGALNLHRPTRYVLPWRPRTNTSGEDASVTSTQGQVNHEVAMS